MQEDNNNNDDYIPKVIFGKINYPNGTFSYYATGYNLDLNFRW